MRVLLEPNQVRALEFIASHQPSREHTTRALTQLQRWSSVAGPPSDRAELTVNFHPDRPALEDETVIDAVLRTGRLMSQFETGSSNGFLLEENDAVRLRRESILFGGAYDVAPASDRPKYGAVNVFANPRGGWPRFGSSHWVLNAAIIDRCTVTVPGSHTTQAWWGVARDLFDLVAEVRAAAAPAPSRHRFHLADGAAELQVHGEVRLNRDITKLVLDPSFSGSSIEVAARKLANTFDIAFSWAPMLCSSGAEWRLRSARHHAHRRIVDAVAARQSITASWIGQDLWSTTPASPERVVADRACRYLWNRLLLSQPLDSPSSPGRCPSSSGSGRSR